MLKVKYIMSDEKTCSTNPTILSLTSKSKVSVQGRVIQV